jgi:cell wall-associated NlpC family hydrolase
VPRLLRAMILGAVAVAVVAPAAAANADPSAGDIRQQIDQSNIAFEKVVEQFNGVNEQLKATQAAADDLNAKMAPLQSNMDAAYANVGQIAVRAYKGGGVSPMAALLSDGSTTGLIEELTALDHVARVQQTDISNYTRTKAQFDEQKTKLDALLNQQRADQKSLADQKARIESDLAKLTDLQNRASRSANTTAPNSGSSSNAGSAPKPSSPPPNIGGGAGTAVRFAYSVLGRPYVYAQAGPGYDCSGLTMAAWAAAGRSLPHNAAMQWNVVAHISSSQLQAGDLIFYYGLGHVAIYIGNGQVIHAPHPGTTVQFGNVNMAPPYGYGRVR